MQSGAGAGAGRVEEVLGRRVDTGRGLGSATCWGCLLSRLHTEWLGRSCGDRRERRRSEDVNAA